MEQERRIRSFCLNNRGGILWSNRKVRRKVGKQRFRRRRRWKVVKYLLLKYEVETIVAFWFPLKREREKYGIFPGGTRDRFRIRIGTFSRSNIPQWIILYFPFSLLPFLSHVPRACLLANVTRGQNIVFRSLFVLLCFWPHKFAFTIRIMRLNNNVWPVERQRNFTDIWLWKTFFLPRAGSK